MTASINKNRSRQLHIMCLLGIHVGEEAVIVLANRDEFHARPALPLHRWKPQDSQTDIFAGKDVEMGGTWMGVNPAKNRWVSILNFRAQQDSKNYISRGHLVTDLLTTNRSIQQFMTDLEKKSDQYRPFILLAGEGLKVWGFQPLSATNRQSIREFPQGAYSVSNGGFDGGWPKQKQLAQAMEGFAEKMVPNTLIKHGIDAMRSNAASIEKIKPADEITSRPNSIESTRFIISPTYGTRCSSVMAISSNKGLIAESTYHPNGDLSGEQTILMW